MVLRRKKLPPGVLEATRDRSGRVVVLTKVAMAHIVRRHRELDGCELAICTAVENATIRSRGKKPGREVLYTPNLGPGPWLAVVVAYDGREGEIITAFGSKGP